MNITYANIKKKFTEPIFQIATSSGLLNVSPVPLPSVTSLIVSSFVFHVPVQNCQPESHHSDLGVSCILTFIMKLYAYIQIRECIYMVYIVIHVMNQDNFLKQMFTETKNYEQICFVWFETVGGSKVCTYPVVY